MNKWKRLFPAVLAAAVCLLGGCGSNQTVTSEKVEGLDELEKIYSGAITIWDDLNS